MLRDILRASPQLVGANTTAVGTASSTSLVDLQSVSFSSGLLGTNGALRVFARITNAGNVGSRVFRLDVKDGSGTYYQLFSQTYVGGTAAQSLFLLAYVAGSGSESTQVYASLGGFDPHGVIWTQNSSLAVPSASTGTASATKTALSIVTRGQTTNAADEVSSDILIVEFIPEYPTSGITRARVRLFRRMLSQWNPR